MGQKKTKEGAKIIHLPMDTIRGLNQLAEASRMKCKPYMEKVLISHEKEKKQINHK